MSPIAIVIGIPAAAALGVLLWLVLLKWTPKMGPVD
jgi:hypothetical protein